MSEATAELKVRPMDEIDIGAITRIDEKVTGRYRPDEWEQRAIYYLRRDPEAPQVAEIDGQVVGFALGEVRSGEFGLEEPTGWVEVMAVDPDVRGRSIGKMLAEALFAHFRERGAKRARTLVDTETMGDLAAFFESVGFEAASLRPLVKNL
ncbi:MAG TPA: GNAT family N-acetyltransferase [bacterium]|nr:GNAT family N-acetyltransferase [bacterium]